MSLPLEKVGVPYPERTAALDADQARAYADATNDPNPAYQSGKYAPPVAGAVPAWDSLAEAMDDLIPPESRPMVVHSSQDMRFSEPLVPGRLLRTTAEAYSVRTGGTGSRLCVRLTSRLESGDPVLDQYATVFIRGLRAEGNAGPEPPRHSLPASARLGAPQEMVLHVDDDQTWRYREASGDQNAIHVDDEAARRAGLPGIIVHGLCTMAMCCRAVVEILAGDDPSRLRRLAVRFSRPVFPGTDLTVRVWEAQTDAGPVGVFEAVSDGNVVVKDGLAEIDPDHDGSTPALGPISEG